MIEKVATFVTLGLQPLRVVESAGFKKMMNYRISYIVRSCYIYILS